MGYAVAGCRALIVVVFAVALTSKLRGWRQFAASVAELRLFPGDWTTSVAAATAAAEGAAVASVVGPSTRVAGWGLVLSGALSAGFAVVVVLVRRRGVRMKCRCFGASGAE